VYFGELGEKWELRIRDWEMEKIYKEIDSMWMFTENCFRPQWRLEKDTGMG